jgi:cytochrome b
MPSAHTNEIKVWDPLVRIFHWSLVLLFATSYLSAEEWDSLHIYAGYSIAGLIIFRLLWGIIGTRYARFTEFVKSPSHVKIYLKDLIHGRARRYIGHNPAGAAMILALLGMLSATIFSGLILLATDGQGPLGSSFFNAWSEDLVEEIHEFFANGTLLLIGLHVAGVIVSSVLHKENLIRAMWTGRKQKEEQDHV